MATSHAERLEVALAAVVRLLAMHGEAPADPSNRTALTTAEGVLLIELLGIGEGTTQQRLAGQLGLDKSRVSRLCSALERKGMVTRQRDDSNRRNLTVTVTTVGAEAGRRLRDTWRERHRRILAAMTAEERRALLLGLDALTRELGAAHGSGTHPG